MISSIIFILIFWTINALFLGGENRPWKKRAKAVTATLEGIALLWLAGQLNPVTFPLSGGETYTLNLHWFGLSITGNFLTALACVALAGSLIITAWILKDAFLNLFQLKLRGWKILNYGGNRTGDYLSYWLWEIYFWFSPWNINIYDEVDRKKVQPKFDRWQLKIKLWLLAFNLALFFVIKMLL